MNYKFYEVVILCGNKPVHSWKFKGITTVCKYLAELDFEVLSAEVFRSDGKKYDVDMLMEVWLNA